MILADGTRALKRKDIASAFGVTVITVSNWKNGGCPVDSIENVRDWLRRRRDLKAAAKGSTANDKTLKTKYGITTEQRNSLLATQGGQCRICAKPISFVDSPKTACIDHCHALHRVRGILCYSCNIGLGQFQDDPKLLIKASEYIEQWQNN
jgi:hypothetical protein